MESSPECPKGGFPISWAKQAAAISAPISEDVFFPKISFSSFSSEVVELFFYDKWLNGFSVLAMHLFGCLAMTTLGIWIYKICSQLLH